MRPGGRTSESSPASWMSGGDPGRAPTGRGEHPGQATRAVTARRRDRSAALALRARRRPARRSEAATRPDVPAATPRRPPTPSRGPRRRRGRGSACRGIAAPTRRGDAVTDPIAGAWPAATSSGSGRPWAAAAPAIRRVVPRHERAAGGRSHRRGYDAPDLAGTRPDPYSGGTPSASAAPASSPAIGRDGAPPPPARRPGGRAEPHPAAGYDDRNRPARGRSGRRPTPSGATSATGRRRAIARRRRVRSPPRGVRRRRESATDGPFPEAGTAPYDAAEEDIRGLSRGPHDGRGAGSGEATGPLSAPTADGLGGGFRAGGAGGGSATSTRLAQRLSGKWGWP